MKLVRFLGLYNYDNLPLTEGKIYPVNSEDSDIYFMTDDDEDGNHWIYYKDQFEDYNKLRVKKVIE